MARNSLKKQSKPIFLIWGLGTVLLLAPSIFGISTPLKWLFISSGILLELIAGLLVSQVLTDAREGLEIKQEDFNISQKPVIEVLTSLDEYMMLKKHSRDLSLNERKKLSDLTQTIEESVRELEETELKLDQEEPDND